MNNLYCVSEVQIEDGGLCYYPGQLIMLDNKGAAGIILLPVIITGYPSAGDNVDIQIEAEMNG